MCDNAWMWSCNGLWSKRGEGELPNACLDAWHVTCYAWREAYADIDWWPIVDVA